MDTQEADPIVFPPMDEAIFAAKLAKWNARVPKKFKPIYGRPSRKRIPREQFQQHISAVKAGRFTERTRKRPLIGRRVEP